MSHSDFQEAIPSIVAETVHGLQLDTQAISAAQVCEQERRQSHIEDFVKSTGKDGTSSREDMAWLEDTFDRLMTKADRHVSDNLSIEDIRVYKWCFELAKRYDRRYWAYRFQYAVYKDLVAASEGSLVHGGKKAQSIAASIFGDSTQVPAFRMRLYQPLERLVVGFQCCWRDHHLC